MLHIFIKGEYILTQSLLRGNLWVILYNSVVSSVENVIEDVPALPWLLILHSHDDRSSLICHIVSKLEKFQFST